MAKAVTTLTLQVTVQIPESMNANDVLEFVRGRLSMRAGEPKSMAPIEQERIGKAVAENETGVRLVRKVTEY